MTIRIASWNVNSITIRLSQVIDVMRQYHIDILALQETKTIDANFPLEDLHRAGFNVLFNGQKSYNGTAFISLEPLKNPRHQLAGMQTDYQRRFLQAEYKNTVLINGYIPNGKTVGDEKYHYKLQWLDCLIKHLKNLKSQGKSVVLMGDFNIAPDDRDVYDIKQWQDGILCSKAERERLKAITDLGFADTFRLFNDEAGHYSWWDYRDNSFQKNWGHRIDLIFSSADLTPYCQESIIEKAPRHWERPSDHAPVIATFTEIC